MADGEVWGMVNAAPEWQAVSLGPAKLRADGGLSTRRACSKCRISVNNLCALSPDEAPSWLVMKKAIRDTYIFSAQVIPCLQYGAKSSHEDSVMNSTTMNGCHPPATVHSQSASSLEARLQLA